MGQPGRRGVSHAWGWPNPYFLLHLHGAHAVFTVSSTGNTVAWASHIRIWPTLLMPCQGVVGSRSCCAPQSGQGAWRNAPLPSPILGLALGCAISCLCGRNPWGAPGCRQLPPPHVVQSQQQHQRPTRAPLHARPSLAARVCSTRSRRLLARIQNLSRYAKVGMCDACKCVGISPSITCRMSTWAC